MSVPTVAVVTLLYQIHVVFGTVTVQLLSDCFVMEMCFLGSKDRIVVFFLLDDCPDV